MAQGHGLIWWPTGRRRALCSATLALCLFSACATGRPLHQRQGQPETSARVAAAGPYTVHAPDALTLEIDSHPELSGTRTVGPDGRLDLGPYGRLRVEGRTSNEITRQVAAVLGEPPDRVRLRVGSYRSRQIYLYGQVNGSQRCVPFEGPETVVHLLQRCGGLTAGAAARDIYVIRPRVADARPPQVFRVNVRDIVTGRDDKTNLVLQPFDEVYVGETRQFSMEKCVPPCMRPLFDAVCELCRTLPFADRWLGPAETSLAARSVPSDQAGR